MIVVKRVQRDERGRITAVVERTLSPLEELVENVLPTITSGLQRSAARGDAKPLVTIGPISPGIDAHALGAVLAQRLGADPALSVFKNGIDLRILPAPTATPEVDDDDEPDDDVDDEGED